MSATIFSSIRNVLIEYDKDDLYASPISENVKLINTAYKQGSKVILTSPKRKNDKSKTEEQLKDLNINYSMLLMEIPDGKKILINHNNKNPDINNAYSINTLEMGELDNIDKNIFKSIINN